MVIADRLGADPDLGSAPRVWPGALATALAFGDALRRHDAAAAHAQLEPGARLLTADGTEVSDPESIGFVLAQLTAPGSRLDIAPRRTIVNGDVALCTQGWRLRAASDRPCFERASSAFFLLRRSGLRWRIAIAAPWG
ncbi:MAG: DUF4440 domain-containing protein [Actinobacteria bacterium]|nr:DUF4440 domain-containing protein [Actinomycetota bacterium]